MCVAGLAEMGFKGRRDAAKFVGGELDAAVELVMGGESHVKLLLFLS